MSRMAQIAPFNEEQNRALVNLDQRYQVWIEAERTLAGLPYDLRRKEIGGRAYLYEINDRSGNGKSLGPWSPQNERKFAAYRLEKLAAKERRDGARAALDESARICRALRLPQLPAAAGEILREADIRDLLGKKILVVGTNAIAAYAIEAAGRIVGAPDTTDDFDIAWTAQEESAQSNTIWDMLMAVDPTFTVNTERPFQARNRKAYEVEILVAPSRAGTMGKTDQPHPVALPEQEWLLRGRAVDRVVPCGDSAARIVAPDPRWFALQKLWLSAQPKRNPLKRAKDRKQGQMLLDAIASAMPQYPLDRTFRDALPAELKPLMAQWRA